MAPSDISGLTGTDPSETDREPGPIGLKGPVLIDRKVVKVAGDWTPPSPATTPEIVVHGKTLADVAAALDKRDEWRRHDPSDAIPAGTSPTIDVTLHAGLMKILPK